MTAPDRPMSPRRLKPGIKLGFLLGGVATVAIVTVIVTAERTQSPPDKSVKLSSDRRDNSSKVPLRQGSADVVADPDRKAIDSTLRQLQLRLATLRHDPTVKPDHWADAQ